MADKTLLKPKRGNVANLGKLAVEDGAMIFAYDTNAPSSTVLVDIGETRYGLASSFAGQADNALQLGGHDPDYYGVAAAATGYAKLDAFNAIDASAVNSTVTLTRADGTTVQRVIDGVANAGTALNANALEGSSLADVNEAIKKATGGGNAVVSMGTATDDTVVLTKADNSTISKVIDNVANAAHATQSDNSTALGGSTLAQVEKKIDDQTGSGAAIIDVDSAAVNSTLTFKRATGTSVTRVIDQVANADHATQADNSSALSGSTIKDINDAIEKATGGGNAVVNIDTATNSTVVYAMASGSSFNKIIDNVANADHATKADDSVALGGSTLAQVEKKIDDQTGSGTAFIDIDSSAINSTLTLKRADGSSVTRTIDQVANADHATQADNSSALGGSSLSDVNEAIKKATGGGNAVVGIDTATNSTLVYAMANGSSFNKVIDNVANADHATRADDADALSGSTLTQINSKIDTQTGSGAAFIDIDSTNTNDTIVLSRAVGGTVARTINNVSNASTADYAKTSNTLGSSTLQDITQAIKDATGGGNAVVGIDTATNSTLVYAMANGTSFNKIIDDVATAGTAQMAHQVGTSSVGSSVVPVYLNGGFATAISAINSTFVVPQQINGVNLNNLRTPGTYWANGSNTNTNKPTGVDAFALEVLQSAGGWYTQVLYASNNVQKQYVRYYNSGTSAWTDWIEQNRLNTKDLSGYVAAPGSASANYVWRTDANGNPYWGTFNDSSLSKLASTVTLGSGDGAMIDQNNGSTRQRFVITDNTSSKDAVFSFQQSTNSGSSYSDLAVIRDDGTVVASTFNGYLDGNAKNALALGGSSLSDVNTRMDELTASGNAFVAVDGAVNSTINFTSANGSTWNRIIDGVANAGTALNANALGGSSLTQVLNGAVSGTATYLKSNPETLQTNANIENSGKAGVRTFLATSSMTSNKPSVGDSHILHMDWNTTAGNNAQLALGNNGHAAIRGQTGSTWSSWNTLLDSANFEGWAAKKTAYTSGTVSGSTLQFARSDNSVGTTLVVDNVANADHATQADNSSALGGSSLADINNRIDETVSASDAMRYLGTIGASSANPTITSLPTTAQVGSAYKVITDGTYSGQAAEVGDLFIYAASGWTLIPSGDDGNVFIGDTKGASFPAQANNIVIAVGSQKVSSAANVTANAGTISALQATVSELKASTGTVTNLNATNGTITNLTATIDGTASASTRLLARDPMNAVTGNSAPDIDGVWMTSATSTNTGYPSTPGALLNVNSSAGGFQLFDNYNSTTEPNLYVRQKKSGSSWTNWQRLLTSYDALTSSASAISSTNNYFTAGAVTAYVQAKATQIAGDYLPLTGGTLTGLLTLQASQNSDAFAGALNLRDSNIYGVNALYFNDVSDNGKEAIHFYRDTSHVDSLWANGGILYFTPNRALGQTGTNSTVLLSSNYTDWAAQKTAYTGATITNATIQLSRSDGSIGTTLTVNNVSNAATASSALNADKVDDFHAVNSSSLTSSDVSGKIVLAKNITDYIDSKGFATTVQLQSALTWIEF